MSKQRVRHILLIFALLFWSVSIDAAAQEGDKSAPFGLEWGMSAAQVKELGADLSERAEKDFGQTYTATKLPKMISDVAAVFVSFGYDDKLWRVVAVSKNFDNDPYGAAVQSRYDELASLLGEKYGPGRQNHHQDSSSVFGSPQNFLTAVQMGRTFHYTDFDSSLVQVQLGIGASTSSTGYYRIIFENKLLRAEFEKGKKAHEKSAL